MTPPSDRNPACRRAPRATIDRSKPSDQCNAFTQHLTTLIGDVDREFTRRFGDQARSELIAWLSIPQTKPIVVQKAKGRVGVGLTLSSESLPIGTNLASTYIHPSANESSNLRVRIRLNSRHFLSRPRTAADGRNDSPRAGFETSSLAGGQRKTVPIFDNNPPVNLNSRLMSHTPSSWCKILIPVFLISVLVGCKPNPEFSSHSNSPTASGSANASDAVEAKETGFGARDSTKTVIDSDLNSVDWRSLSGKEVVIEGDLVIVDTYDLARYGRIKVARERLYIPTNRIDPNDADPNGNAFEGGSNVANVTAAQKMNDSSTIIIDDSMSDQNVFPPPLFPELGDTHPTVRVGSVVKGAAGRLIEDRNELVLQSEKPLDWLPSQRPERPNVGDADVVIASFNVLNYFTTIDDGKNNARGADSETELVRQEAKIVSAIEGLQADIIGLMELENNTDAEDRLVAALNKRSGQTLYKGCGIPEGFDKSPGSGDAIRVGIIYRTDRVVPVGDVSMITDNAFRSARTPIVQTFQSTRGGKPLTVIVNHFKSKGGAANANAENKNNGDGQAAYNAARRAQALAICNYISEQDSESESSRFLVIGDLNAYQQEDPIDALRANGLVDLLERFRRSNQLDASDPDYSFLYYGQCGSLDHAFATESFAKDMTGIATWHINADEPRFIDYNEEFNPKTLYAEDPYRSSDHDPVIIGIRK